MFHKSFLRARGGVQAISFTRFPTRVSLMLSDTKSLCKKTTDDPNPSEGKYWRLAISGEPNQLWRGQAFTSSQLARQRDPNQIPFHLPVLLVAVATFLSHRHLPPKKRHHTAVAPLSVCPPSFAVAFALVTQLVVGPQRLDLVLDHTSNHAGCQGRAHGYQDRGPHKSSTHWQRRPINHHKHPWASRCAGRSHHTAVRKADRSQAEV